MMARHEARSGPCDDVSRLDRSRPSKVFEFQLQLLDPSV